MIVDTHCHLHFDEFDADREQVIRRAREAGVQWLVNVGTDPETNENAYELAKQDDFMAHTVGLHPHSAHEADDDTFARLERQVVSTKPSAIGEVGLDYFKSEGDPATQKKVFGRMLELARRHSLPVIVHSREAFEDTHAMLKEAARAGVRGVMHCFSYDEAAMKKMADLGFFISFACNITFKKAEHLFATAKATPADRLVVETDSPYLSLHRGKRNEPANLAQLVPLLASARGVDAGALSERTTANAKELFGLS